MVTAIVNRKAQSTKRFRPMWRQDQAVATGFKTGEAPLYEVDAAGHGSQMDALGGRAALDVGDVGLEHLLEEFKSSITI